MKIGGVELKKGQYFNYVEGDHTLVSVNWEGVEKKMPISAIKDVQGPSLRRQVVAEYISIIVKDKREQGYKIDRIAHNFMIPVISKFLGLHETEIKLAVAEWYHLGWFEPDEPKVTEVHI